MDKSSNYDVLVGINHTNFKLNDVLQLYSVDLPFYALLCFVFHSLCTEANYL